MVGKEIRNITNNEVLDGAAERVIPPYDKETVKAKKNIHKNFSFVSGMFNDVLDYMTKKTEEGIDEQNIKEVFDELKEYIKTKEADLNNVYSIENTELDENIHQIRENDPFSPEVIAYRMNGHDIKKPVDTALRMITSVPFVIEYAAEEKEQEKYLLNLFNKMYERTNLTAMLTTAQENIAIGNTDHKPTIPIENMPYFLRLMDERGVKPIKDHIKGRESWVNKRISPLEFMLLWQPVKNAQTESQLTVFENGTYILYGVQDEGNGIYVDGSPATVNNVLDIFNMDKTNKKEGTGLGLAIIKEITRMLEGEYGVVTKTEEDKKELSKISNQENHFMIPGIPENKTGTIILSYIPKTPYQ